MIPFQPMSGHSEVTAMSFDPWPPRYWLLVILVMQDLVQPNMSHRINAQAKWLKKSKHARYWLEIKSSFSTHHVESHFG